MIKQNLGVVQRSLEVKHIFPYFTLTMDLERQGTSKKSDQEGLVYSVGSSPTQPQQHKSSWSISVLFRRTHGVKINFCLEAAKAGRCSNARGDSTCKTDILSTETTSTCRWYNVSELCDIAKCYVAAINPLKQLIPGLRFQKRFGIFRTYCSSQRASSLLEGFVFVLVVEY